MRLTLKLTLAYLLAVAAIIALQAYLRFRIGLETHAQDEDRDHARVATAVARLVAQAWSVEGSERALEALHLAEEAETGLRIRFVCASADDTLEDAPPCAELLLEKRSRVVTGTPTEEGVERRATLEPVVVAGRAVGLLEVSEPIATERAWRRETIERLATFGLGIVLATTLVSLLAGLWFVARPTSLLAAKAARVGQGDLEHPLHVRTHDEFEDLAHAMNVMCEHLATARDAAQRDALARTRAEAQLRHAERLATVGTLASGVAHELGTPLSVIEARADLLTEGNELSERQRKHVRAIVEASARMTRIVQQLLLFARETPRSATRLEAAAMLRDAAAFVAPVAHARRVTFELEPGPEDLAFTGDRVLVEQAIVNLLMNAVQASSEGSSVRIATRRDELRTSTGEIIRAAALTITDRGTGIEEAHVARIFEPFFTTKAPGEGTGLGLSVVHAIVVDHGGTVHVDSLLSVGTTFTLRFPLVA